MQCFCFHLLQHLYHIKRLSHPQMNTSCPHFSPSVCLLLAGMNPALYLKFTSVIIECDNMDRKTPCTCPSQCLICWWVCRYTGCITILYLCICVNLLGELWNMVYLLQPVAPPPYHTHDNDLSTRTTATITNQHVPLMFSSCLNHVFTISQSCSHHFVDYFSPVRLVHRRKSDCFLSIFFFFWKTSSSFCQTTKMKQQTNVQRNNIRREKCRAKNLQVKQAKLSKGSNRTHWQTAQNLKFCCPLSLETFYRLMDG